MAQQRYYQHSGQFALLGPFLMALLAGLTAVTLGAIYGYAIFYIPFIYINVFLVLGFGFAVGMAVGVGAKMGKVRNMAMVLAAGFGCGLLADYAGWVAWIHAATEQEALLLHPGDVLQMMSVIAADGAWSLSGWTPTGIWLYIVWGLEALMIIGLSTLTGWSQVSTTPFCERCDEWLGDAITSPPLEPLADPSSLKSQLEAWDFSAAEALVPVAEGSAAYTQMSLTGCARCPNQKYLTVEAVVVSTDSEGKESKNESDLVETLIVNSETYDALQAGWGTAAG